MTADIVELASVLSSPSRVEMLFALGEHERTVTELAHVAGIGMASASYHVEKMAESGLVQVRPYGNRRVISLKAREVRLRFVP
jgi:DNA-binding transcriptional ArsR family regulator